MKLDEIEKIAVLGAGLMGHGIAQRFAMGGYSVRLFDVNRSILDTAKQHIQKNLELFHQYDLIGEGEIEPSLNRIQTTMDLREAVEDADFVVEAAPEDLKLKQDLFERIESCCREDAILASNTSSLTLKEIGVRVKNKERLVTTHWFNPPHIVPTVEVVKSDWTSEETMEIAYGLLVKIKKSPVRINKEMPGFLINRIQLAMAREVLDLYEKGVAEAAEIDKAVKGSMGFRLASIGPLLTMDLAGLKLWLTVAENLFPEIQSSTEPPMALKRLTAQGHDGIKSGKGFHDYAVDFSKEELDKAIQKRDREFLVRLKQLHWNAQE
jgi:3-hydroxybutyryl-CoA dehydrogenase